VVATAQSAYTANFMIERLCQYVCVLFCCDGARDSEVWLTADKEAMSNARQIDYTSAVH